MLRRLPISWILILFWSTVQAQAPSGIPYGEADPLEFNLANIIFFIVIPVLLIVVYFLNRKKQKRKQIEKQNK